MKTIALVEDEKDLNNLIKTYLEKEGYNVVSYYDGESAINNINNNIDLWILDIMLGDNISGYDIIKKIREESTMVPVIFTSARDKDLDKIIGLELGSDDYIAKPYSPKELVLRVNNIIRRVYSKEKTKLTYKDYSIDLEKRMVLLNDTSINLTTLEFDLLYNNPDGTFNFKGLLDDLSEVNAKEDVLMALSALLSAATDNAKELILSKINASQSTIELFCSMLGTGYSIKEILDVFSSP